MTNKIRCVGMLACCTLLFGTIGCSRKSPDSHLKRETVEQELLPAIRIQDRPLMMMSLQDRMRYYNVPGLSIAVLEDNRLEWAQGYGLRENGSTDQVTAETPFQAASTGKLLTALCVMSLVEEGKLQLDADVNAWLKNWTIAENEFTLEQAVTLRQLLSHSAGTTVAEFPGYPQDQKLPSVAQILDGVPPANTPPVEVLAVPGTQWAYSGGGYTIVQQVLEDLSGKRFADLVQTQLFTPLKLKQSSFAQPLPAPLAKMAAHGHYGNGRPLKGGWRLYPESAAAGLWSTPSDLARLIEEIQKAAAGTSSKILSSTLSKSLFTPQIGNSAFVGPINGQGDARWFSSGGSTVGYRSFMVFFPERGQGAIVMTNSDNGHYLAMEIMRGIARVYDWPDFHPQERVSIASTPDMLAQYDGEYEVIGSPDMLLRIHAGTEQLTLEFSGERFVLYPESEAQFFELTTGMTISFDKGPEGNATEFLLRSPLSPRPWKARKKIDETLSN